MNRKFLRLNKIIFIMIVGLLFSGCAQNNNDQKNTNPVNNKEPVATEKAVIFTTFYPLYDFAKKIAGDKAEVINLVPAGTEPHDYEPTAQDVVKLNDADILVYNGTGFEGWIEKIIPTLNNKNLIAVDSSRDVDLLTAEDTGFVKEEEEADHQDEDREMDGGFDPHYWLAPMQAKKQAKTILDTLVQLDPVNQSFYEENYAKLAEQFDKLDTFIKNIVSQASRKELIVSHAAFGYLTHSYGLKQISISGISPSDEPTQKELRDIIEFAKENQIKYIMFETLVSAKIAEMVQNEIGAQALVLNPLEGLTDEQMAKGKDYFSVMKENAENIKIAVSN